MKLRLSIKALIFLLIFLFLTFSSLAQPLYADCLACWELKSVEIQLNDKTILEGYIAWNDAWYGTYDEKFPDVLFNQEDQIENISFYSDIRTINYPDSGYRVTLTPPQFVLLYDISNISIQSGLHNGYTGAGKIPLVSERIANLLLTEPIAFCKGSGSLSIIYWVSYNSIIAKDDIDCICNSPFGQFIEHGKNLEQLNLVKLEFSYD